MKCFQCTFVNCPCDAGASIGGTEVDAQIAGTIAAPVLLALKHGEGPVFANELFNKAMLKRQTFARNKVRSHGRAQA